MQLKDAESAIGKKSKNHNSPFMLKYCPNRYKTLEISDKAVDDFLPALKFVSNCILSNKVIKKLVR